MSFKPARPQNKQLSEKSPTSLIFCVLRCSDNSGENVTSSELSQNCFNFLFLASGDLVALCFFFRLKGISGKRSREDHCPVQWGKRGPWEALVRLRVFLSQRSLLSEDADTVPASSSPHCGGRRGPGVTRAEAVAGESCSPVPSLLRILCRKELRCRSWHHRGQVNRIIVIVRSNSPGPRLPVMPGK